MRRMYNITITMKGILDEEVRVVEMESQVFLSTYVFSRLFCN